MKTKNTSEGEGQLSAFRQNVYEKLAIRSDALLDTVDALSGNQGASSVAELSLNPLFGREYSSLYDGIASYTQALSEPEARQGEQSLSLPRLLLAYLPVPQVRPFWLLGVDGTPLPRPYAATMSERGFVYAPNPTPGVKPLTLGQQASSVVLLPEKTAGEPSWVVPLGMQRIGQQTGEIAVALQQLQGLLDDPDLPFHAELSVTVADSKYGQVPFLHPLVQYDNQVVIVRVRGNRVFYRPASPPVPPSKREAGRPKVYGVRFALGDAQSWGEPAQQVETHLTSTRGHVYRVVIQQWGDLLMHGKQAMAMATHPFNLLRIQLFRSDGSLLFKRPLWLIAIGQRRAEIAALPGWQAYRQRFDHEHFFRFGKQRLLLDKFQTPDTDRIDTWLLLVQLAYLQLWLARRLANAMPTPWQRYLPQPVTGQAATPSHAQRDFPRIIRQIGTPAQVAKPRGKSPGRPNGAKMTPRPCHPILRKAKNASLSP